MGSSTLQAVVVALGIGKIVAGYCVNSQEVEMTIRVPEYSNVQGTRQRKRSEGRQKEQAKKWQERNII